MTPLDPTEALAAAIRNAAWMVRHYRRPMLRRERAQAVLRLGMTVRHAFNQTEHFEPLLVAIVESLAPRDDPPPF